MELLGYFKMKNKVKIFLPLSIALTFISVYAGFSYYSALFGITVAIFASFAFETLRLASLYGFFGADLIRKWVSLALYIVSALVCSFASVAAFNGSVIMQYDESIREQKTRQEKEIAIIKTEISARREKEIERIRKNENWCNIQLAKRSNSSYWNNRLLQIENEMHFTEARFDSILSYIPERDVEEWIEREASKYGIKRLDKSERFGRPWAIAKAVQDMYGISEIEMKKLSGLMITLGVEFSIFILALLASIPNAVMPKALNGKAKILFRKFGKDSVLGFIKKHCNNGCDIPNQSALSRKHREIKKYIVSQDITKDELNKMLAYSDE